MYIQTLLGDTQWVRNCAGMSNAEIAQLTSLLHGSHPSTKVTLSETQQMALQHIVQKLQIAWTARQLLTLPVSLLIRTKKGHPMPLFVSCKTRRGRHRTVQYHRIALTLPLTSLQMAMIHFTY